MAAIRSGVTPGCLARCFLRQSEKPGRGARIFSDVSGHRLLQRSRLHTALAADGTSAMTLLGCRTRGKVLWVSAVAVRYNSSQVPPEDLSTVAPPTSPVLESTVPSVPADPYPVFTEQIAPEPLSSVVVVHPSAPPPPVLNSSSELLVADPAPVLTNPVLEQVSEVAAAAAVTEPTLAELGLASYTPVGLIQNLLEFMHINLDLPWWGAIVLGTVVARVAVFPLIVKGQREAAKLTNVMPEMSKLSAKVEEAKQSGNKFEFSKAYSELTLFMQKNDVNPLRGFLIPAVQAPIFMSFFFALRSMANLPVPSLQTGGLLWFPDLTVADPFYILPLLATGTMLCVLELGAESGVANPNLKVMKTVFRIMPFVILPMTINFPAAVFTYWMTSNTFSLGQMALLNHRMIRQRLGIPEKVQHPPSAQPQTKGFLETIKKGWESAQITHQLQERERRIKQHLDMAAKGPIKQTFTHNPLLQNPLTAAASPKDKAKAKPWKDTVV